MNLIKTLARNVYFNVDQILVVFQRCMKLKENGDAFEDDRIFTRFFVSDKQNKFLLAITDRDCNSFIIAIVHACTDVFIH